MKKLILDEPTADELVLIWKSQAFEIATISKTPDPVGRFLESKRIPKHEASVAAIMIWNEAQKSLVKSEIPGLVSGSAVLGIGLVYEFFAFQSGPLFVMFGIVPIIFGAWMLLNAYLNRR